MVFVKIVLVIAGLFVFVPLLYEAISGPIRTSVCVGWRDILQYEGNNRAYCIRR